MAEHIAFSKVEQFKNASHDLRFPLVEEMAQDTAHLSEASAQILKFHGSYQQDDRDQRKSLVAAGKEPHYSFMIRIKIPGGDLTAEQYLTVEDLADQYANGTLRITTRQNIQLHCILKKNLKATLRKVNECLLTTLAGCGDVERNVLACPAPFPDEGHIQVQAAAHALAVALCPKTRAYHEIWMDGEQVAPLEPGAEEEPLYGKTYLPRKFKTAIAFPGDNCVDVVTNDIALIAVLSPEGRHEGFNICVGGGMGMNHADSKTYPRLATPMGFVLPEDLVAIVEAIVKTQRDHGDRTNRKHARMKYLVEERGIDWFRQQVEERWGHPVAHVRPTPTFTVQNHLGWHPQGDGRDFLGVFVENGRVKDEGGVRLKTALRQVIQEYRPALRLTPRQDILLTNLNPSDRNPIEELFHRHGVTLPDELPRLRLNALACPALPTCGLAITEAERALPQLIRGLEDELNRLSLGHEEFSVRMTGCPNGCTRPSMGELAFIGRTPGAGGRPGTYNMYLGGNASLTRLNQLYAERVPYEDLIKTVVPLLELFKQERQPGEGFGDFCYRLGIEGLKQRGDSDRLVR